MEKKICVSFLLQCCWPDPDELMFVVNILQGKINSKPMHHEEAVCDFKVKEVSQYILLRSLCYFQRM